MTDVTNYATEIQKLRDLIVRLTEHRDSEIVKDRDAGMSWRDLAKKNNITDTRVQQIYNASKKK